jgi:hypothetical protein
MLEVLLAVLSGSAAAGMRIALPLLVILLYGGDRWANMPIVASIHPPVVFSILVSWSILELVGSKNRVGQRFLQTIELVVSPIVGGVIGYAIAASTGLPTPQVMLLAAISGLLAFVLQLVQLGWMYRSKPIPLALLFGQDLACVLLILFAFDAPTEGGLIALLLLWLAIRSATQWRRWYEDGRSGLHQPDRM